MSLRTVFDSFSIVVDAPNQVVKLRELLLQLGVSGELTGRWPRIRNLQRKASWKTVGFFDFCVLQRGYDLPLSKCDDGRFPIVTSAGIAAYHSEYKATGPGVVVGRSGSIGKVFYVEENFWPHNTALYVRDFKGNYPRFVYYYLLSFKAAQFSKSTAVPTLNRNNLRGFQVDVPSLGEQKQIVLRIEELMRLCDELEAQQQAQRESRVHLNAAVLAPLNEAVSLAPEEFELATKRLADNFGTLYESIDTVSTFRSTILQLAVQGRLVTQDSNDEPSSILLRRIEQERESEQGPKRKARLNFSAFSSSDGPFQIPSSWRWTRLGQLTKLIEYGTSEKASVELNGVPILRMNNIEGGRVRLSNLKYVSPLITDLPRLYLIPNELLFNRTNSFELVGKTGIFKGDKEKFTFASYLIRIRLHESFISPDYVNLAMNAAYFRTTQINTNVTQQCGQANFNGTKLANTMIPLPPLAEQKRIIAKVSQLMSLCDELEAKLRQAEADTERLMNAAVKHVLESVRDVSKTAEEVFA